MIFFLAFLVPGLQIIHLRLPSYMLSEFEGSQESCCIVLLYLWDVALGSDTTHLLHEQYTLVIAEYWGS